MEPIHRNFEVQVLHDGQWHTESVRDGEDEARHIAEKALGEKKCSGARIVANRIHRDGSVNGKVVFQKLMAAEDDPLIRIDPLDAAPVFCETADDIFSLQSRTTINRLLRSYLESVQLTPTELLHGFRHLQRLGDRGSLLAAALGHLAKLQTAGTFRPPEDSQDELFDLATRVVDRAKRADSLRLPKLGRRFSETLAAVTGVGYDTPEYLGMVILSRELNGRPSWLEKLDLLCRLAVGEDDAKALLLIDTVIADVLGSGFLDAFLNGKRSLGDAVAGLFDLADGRYEVAGGAAFETIDALNGLLSAGALPASRRVIIERALRRLRSATPLFRADPAKELEEYQRTLARLLAPNGHRLASSVADHGAGPSAGGTATAIHLMELKQQDPANGQADDIIHQLDRVFSARVIGQLFRRSMSDAGQSVDTVEADPETFWTPPSDPDVQRVCEHIDDVLERYLIDENIIEKLDRPDDPIRDRAVRLAKFCGAGVLPEGKALNLARQRVVRLLRQPRFDVRFVEGIHDLEMAEKALRDFNELLVKARLP